MNDVSKMYEHAVKTRVPVPVPTAKRRKKESQGPADREKPIRRQSDRSPLESETSMGSETSETVDRMVNATVARFSLGFSLVAMSMAYYDWFLHLAGSPGK